MNPLLSRFLRQAVGGLAVIAIGVPLVQNQMLVLSTSEGPALSVSGDISGLSPDRPGRLLLTVRNDGGAATVVGHLSAVPEKQVAGCTIAIAPWAGRLPVAAGGSAEQTLTVRVSGPRCGGVSWALTYTATA